jgi:hypothetical protein
MQNRERQTRAEKLCVVFFVACLLLFLALGAYQLVLPGLHYDEAKEAGLNAMELITGQPVTAFRGATIQFGPWRLPLMVQDYIGALNVVLAVPFLGIGGVNVVALRWLSLLTGALTLAITWRIAWRLGGPLAASATALLLAVNPAFIFWSRQGVFVTNLAALIFMASLLTGLRWWEQRRPRDLWLTAFLWGLGLYAKLLFAWAIGAMVIFALLAWLLEARSSKPAAGGPRVAPSVVTDNPTGPDAPWSAGSGLRSRASTSASASTLALALVFFLLPLIPLIIFNLRTGGTLHSIFGNLGRSYYGVNNSAYLPNLLMRLGQVSVLLRAQHLSYLGGPFANTWAPWLLVALVLFAGFAAGLKGMARTSRRPGASLLPALRVAVPLLLLALIVAQSAFTVSDLFITHYALLAPLIPLAGGLAFGAVMAAGGEDSGRAGDRFSARGGRLAPNLLRAFAVIALVAWAGGDLVTDIRYHRALAVTGGHGPHSDAIYALAETLDRDGLTAPVALDWGLDAQVRFLTAGRVQPTEVFGYDDLAAPDPGYAERMNQLLDDPDRIYLAHVPEHTVFRDRVNALAELAGKRGLKLREQAYFNERDGSPFIVVYRAGK